MYVCEDGSGREQYTNVNNSMSCRPLRKARSRSRGRGLRVQTLPGPAPLGSYSNIYDRHISRSSRLYKVDPYLIKAVIKAESNFDRYALSPAGAQGLMQLMPETARELRVGNPFNPYENIAGGTRYLHDMLVMFEGDVVLSLAAYNAGPTLVKRLQRVPRNRETVRYVQKVLTYYRGYRDSLSKTGLRLAAVGKK